MLRLTLSLLLALVPAAVTGQLLPQQIETDAEFRALHAPSAAVVWAAGRGGTYAVTADGGATWDTGMVPGAPDLFLTGVWAANEHTAYILATDFDGGLARIYRTDDGGSTWSQQWEQAGDGVFMDALQCWSIERCVAFGDPVGGRLVIVRTTDGKSWQRVPADSMPSVIDGEAGFAASGATLALAGTAHGWIGTGGGAIARVYMTRDGGASWSVADTPMTGNASSGIFAVAFHDSLNGVAVGGDYLDRTGEHQTVLRSTDGGMTWAFAGVATPHGVRYGVASSPVTFVAPRGAEGGGAQAPIRAIVAVGPSGAGVSHDDGSTWRVLDPTSWNTVVIDATGNAWLAGPAGRIARVERGALISRSTR